MRPHNTLLGVCFGAALLLAGCGGSIATVGGDESPGYSRRSATSEPVYHDWQRIYLIEITQSGPVRHHVGFLDRRYSEDDKEGKSFVLGRSHDELGFVLPSGAAFAIDAKPDGSWKLREIGMTGFELGVREILGIAGGLEFERVTEISSSPPSLGQD